MKSKIDEIVTGGGILHDVAGGVLLVVSLELLRKHVHRFTETQHGQLELATKRLVKLVHRARVAT